MTTLTQQQVADYIGVHRRTLWLMIKSGRFPVPPIKGTKPKRWAYEAVEQWRTARDE